MKKFKYVLGMVGVLAIAFAVSTPVSAASTKAGIISTYTESIMPNGKDGELTVTVTAKADKSGNVYISNDFKKMKLTEVISSKNLEDSKVKAINKGELKFFVGQASNKAKAVTIKAKFEVPGFYAAAPVGPVTDDTGGYKIPYDVKFTNPFETTIQKYTLTVAVKKNNEILDVSNPQAYAGYKLNLKDGYRTISVSSKKGIGLAPLTAVELTFNAGTPHVDSFAGAAIIWVICLVIGGAVLIARLPRNKGDKKE